MHNAVIFEGILGRHPKLWAALAAFTGLIGTYGIFAALFGAPFWPDAVIARYWLVAWPFALLVSGAFAGLVWYHLAHGLSVWPIAGGIHDRPLPRFIRISLLILIAYIGLVFGETATVLLYSTQSPFGPVLDGITAYWPFDKPMLPLWTWPLVFAAATGVMHWICWAALRPVLSGDEAPAQ